MDWNSIFQGVLANAVWWIALLLGGIVLTLLKVKKPAWASALLYGLAGMALLAILAYTFTGTPWFLEKRHIRLQRISSQI